jgi:toxin ParE1/3/4
MRLLFSPRAQIDLDEIWTYTAARWDAEQAEGYLRQIQQVAIAITQSPEIGRRCDDIRPGYLKRPVGSHVIFYRVGAGVVDVVRILHQRMDFNRHL